MTLFPFRIAPGHIAKSTLQTTPSYLISGFAKTTDMKGLLLWYPNTPAIDNYDAALYQRGLSGAGAVGAGFASLTFPVMTPGMIEYFNTTYLPSGALRAAVTVQLPDDRVTGATATAVYTAYILRPETLGAFYQRRIWRDVSYRLTELTLLT